jgi:hypothetical protein
VARRNSVKDELDQLGSWGEAWRQLVEASRKCALIARGVFVPAQDDGWNADADPIEREIPAAAFLNPGPAQNCRLHNAIYAPWGCYIQVSYEDEAVDQIWPMPTPANITSPEHVVKWMLNYAKRNIERGHRVKKVAAIHAGMTETSATWRQAEKAYRELPAEYKNKPRRPKAPHR